MSRLTRAGVLRAVVVFGALTAFPFVFPAQWIVNIAIFTLMYAGLATAWNLLGGFSGYLSLGHAAFFGVGAYAIAIAFTHIGIGGSGYKPFYALPLVGIAVGLVSIPIAWVALRVRAATFAIVTLTPTPRARSSSSRIENSISPSLDPRTHQQVSSASANTASIAK